MSLGHRLWRVARRRVLDGLGLVQGATFRSVRSAARKELEEFLRDVAHRRAEARAAPAANGAPPPSERRPPPPRTPPPPPKHPYAAEYAILGVPAGADLTTVRRTWRRLVRETHPDRFTGDPRAQRDAADRLRRFNDAYHALAGYLQRQVNT